MRSEEAREGFLVPDPEACERYGAGDTSRDQLIDELTDGRTAETAAEPSADPFDLQPVMGPNK